MKKCRIYSIEARDIVVNSKNNDLHYDLNINKNSRYGKSINLLDYSLDYEELKRVYESITNEPFHFYDKYLNAYTLAIINIKFTYTSDPKNKAKKINKKTLRKILYQDGFYIDNKHYVRYKRSSGSSREGTCLFIDERLLEHMQKWGECNLTHNGYLSSWEAYKSLSLSSIKNKIKIPLDGILFINDYESKFNDDVIYVEEENNELVAKEKNVEISNNIWDGESLLDESLFKGSFSNKHMLLLRNKFFKSCAFKTKLQKWFKDNNFTNLELLKEKGAITFAKSIDQIVMVTTKSSLKFIKFLTGFNEESIREWMKYVNDEFGVVKYDKRTKYFNGRMVKGNYQLFNTIGLKELDVHELLKDSIDYISLIRKDIDFFKYHFYEVIKKESDDNSEKFQTYDRYQTIFKLMNVNSKFQYTQIFKDFKNDIVASLKKELKNGGVLLKGCNATLFGNGPELLYAAIGKFDYNNPNPGSVLKQKEIRCLAFDNDEELVCIRSPHITMGNVYTVKNSNNHPIWDYFDLGKNIVCVNAINENIQQILNGCDYDSDAMLITNNKLLYKRALEYSSYFKVPVCGVKSIRKHSIDLIELDHQTSENRIGEIVNLSQKLNSIIWNKLNNNEMDISDIYIDACKLAVLSGIEIDKAKRSFNIDGINELVKIRTKYKDYHKPMFFKDIDSNNNVNKNIEYSYYLSPMDFIYYEANKIDFRSGKSKNDEKVLISSMLSYLDDDNENVTEVLEDIKETIKIYTKEIDYLNGIKRKLKDESEKEVIYEDINNLINERNEVISKKITSPKIMYYLIKDFEKGKITDYRFYSPLFENNVFLEILNQSKEKMAKIIESNEGEYTLFDFKYNKKY